MEQTWKDRISLIVRENVQHLRSNDNMVRRKDKLLLIIFVIVVLYVLLSDRLYEGK